MMHASDKVGVNSDETKNEAQCPRLSVQLQVNPERNVFKKSFIISYTLVRHTMAFMQNA